MVKLKAVPPLQNRIELPDFISAACSDTLASYCKSRGITDNGQVFELTALIEETAQRIHLALTQQNKV